MILRKPYAFLIKNFKLLHAIITAFMIFVFYRTFGILSFYSDYILSSNGIIGEEISSTLYNPWMFISVFAIIVISIILLTVMIVKKKPSTLYITNIIIYIFVLVIFVLGKSTTLKLEISLLDIRTIKVVRDLSTIAMLIQTYPLIKSFIRAVGFDIKKFDFGKDLADLEIEEKDNEEFEVKVSVDTNKMKRHVNSKERISKYIYAENKFLINTVIVVFILIIVGIVTFGIIKAKEKSSIGTTFTMNGFKIKPIIAYSTHNDYRGNKLNGIDDKKSVVVVPIEMKNNNSTNRQIVTANIELVIGEHKFRHTSIYRDGLFDIGSSYDGEIINSGDTTTKLLVFEVPTAYLKKQMYLKFITSITIKGKDLIPTYVTIGFNPIDLDSEASITTINPSEETTLSNSVIGSTKLTINSVELNKRFKVDYKYCLSSNNCIDSYEYLLPKLNTNTDLALMKVSGDVTYDDNYKNNSLSYLYDLIKYFGSLNYEVDGKIKTLTSDMNKVNPTFYKSNNVIYLSVPSDALRANNINLIIKIRNQQYVYIVK